MARKNLILAGSITAGIFACLACPQGAHAANSLLPTDVDAYSVTYRHESDADVLSIEYEFENPFSSIVELDAEEMGDFIEKSYAFQLNLTRIYSLSCTTVNWDKEIELYTEVCEASFTKNFFPKKTSGEKAKITATQLATTDGLAKFLTSDAAKQASIKDSLAKDPLNLNSALLSIKDATEDTYTTKTDTDTRDSTSTTTTDTKTTFPDSSISALIAAGGDGCSLAGGTPANPIIFLLIGIAILPIARRR